MPTKFDFMVWLKLHSIPKKKKKNKNKNDIPREDNYFCADEK